MAAAERQRVAACRAGASEVAQALLTRILELQDLIAANLEVVDAEGGAAGSDGLGQAHQAQRQASVANGGEGGDEGQSHAGVGAASCDDSVQGGASQAAPGGRDDARMRARRAAEAAEAAEMAEAELLRCLITLHALCVADVRVVGDACGRDPAHIIRGLMPALKVRGAWALGCVAWGAGRACLQGGGRRCCSRILHCDMSASFGTLVLLVILSTQLNIFALNTRGSRHTLHIAHFCSLPTFALFCIVCRPPSPATRKLKTTDVQLLSSCLLSCTALRWAASHFAFLSRVALHPSKRMHHKLLVQILFASAPCTTQPMHVSRQLEFDALQISGAPISTIAWPLLSIATGTFVQRAAHLGGTGCH